MQSEVDFSLLFEMAPTILRNGLPIMLRGRHGIGKTAVIYEIGKELGLPVVERRISQLGESDLVGIPKLYGNTTKFFPQDWLIQACEQAVLLSLDEIDRGRRQISQSIFELVGSRKFYGHKLHKDTCVMSACNGGKCRQSYYSLPPDPAELDRWVVFDIEPTVNEWITWAKREQVSPDVIQFISLFPMHLEHKNEFENDIVYPSRRSWGRLGLNLNSFSKRLQTNVDMLSGFVGVESAAAFVEFLTHKDSHIDMSPFSSGMEELKKASNQENLTIIDRMLQSGDFNRQLSNEEIKLLASYFSILPPEISMALWNNIANNNQKNMQTFSNCKIGKVTVRQKIASILSGE